MQTGAAMIASRWLARRAFRGGPPESGPKVRTPTSRARRRGEERGASDPIEEIRRHLSFEERV
jgi:hypothetical protein